MIQVALCPSEIRRISATDLSDVTAVVFDVLRATSSIITGLASGVEAIFPVRTVEEARERKVKDPDLLLAGERGGLPPEGFDLGNSPEEFEKAKGRRVVMTTTNGTAAIESVRTASKVLIGALLNIDALANYLFTHPPGRLLLVCAGTGEEFSLEDAVAAGALVARLSDDQRLSDSAIITRSIYEQVGDDLHEWVRQTQNGKALRKIGKDADITWCARLSVFDLVCQLKGDKITCSTER
jgi:2-phosphosulfolactate phosphatase